MEKITVFVGLNDKDSKKQEISFIEARSLLSQFIAQVVGVGTLSEAAGVYTHDNGETVQERTIRAEFYVEDREPVMEFGGTIYGGSVDELRDRLERLEAATDPDAVAMARGLLELGETA